MHAGPGRRRHRDLGFAGWGCPPDATAVGVVISVVISVVGSEGMTMVLTAKAAAAEAG